MKAILFFAAVFIVSSAQAKVTVKPGEPAPCVTITQMDVKGEASRSSCETSVAGKNLVLEFFATDCHWCVQNLPVFEGFAAKFKGRASFRVVGEDKDPNLLRAFFGKRDFSNYEVAFDCESKVYDAFGIRGTPTLIVIGPNKKVKYVHLGTVESPAEIAEAEAAIVAP